MRVNEEETGSYRRQHRFWARSLSDCSATSSAGTSCARTCELVRRLAEESSKLICKIGKRRAGKNCKSDRNDQTEELSQDLSASCNLCWQYSLRWISALYMDASPGFLPSQSQFGTHLAFNDLIERQTPAQGCMRERTGIGTERHRPLSHRRRC